MPSGAQSVRSFSYYYYFTCDIVERRALRAEQDEVNG
jgi:hypothetical protein